MASALVPSNFLAEASALNLLQRLSKIFLALASAYDFNVGMFSKIPQQVTYVVYFHSISINWNWLHKGTINLVYWAILIENPQLQFLMNIGPISTISMTYDQYPKEETKFHG